MPRLNAANDARTYLVEEITAGQTTITVLDSSSFPAPPFRATVDGEIIEVTAMNGNTWSVIRGLEGTTDEFHYANSEIENEWTAGTYQELSDFSGNYNDLKEKPFIPSKPEDINAAPSEHEGDIIKHNINVDDTQLTYENGNLTIVQEYLNNSLVKRTDLTYTGENLTSIRERFYDNEGAVSHDFTTTLSYTEDELTTVTRSGG